MMKRHYIYIIMCILLPLLVVGCEDKFDPEGKDDGKKYDGVSYLSFSINVPDGESDTRAGDTNADLEHGTAKEYEIYNAYLMLFEQEGTWGTVNVYDNNGDITGTKEDWVYGAQTFCDVFEIYDRKQTVPPNQITHISSRYIIRNLRLWDFIPKENTAAKTYRYYGVILANINDRAVRIDLSNKTISFRDKDGNFPTENTFSATAKNQYDNKRNATHDLKNKTMMPMSVANAQGDNFLSMRGANGDKYLMMSNAMLFPNKAGLQEMVELTGKFEPHPSTDPDYVDETWPQFYLERIAAKVEVTATDESNASTVTGSITVDSQTYYYRLNRWCLANVSPNSYIMRHGDMQWAQMKNSPKAKTTENRFTSYSHIESTTTPNTDPNDKAGLYRGYFCESTEFLKCTRGVWGKQEQSYAVYKEDPESSGNWVIDHYDLERIPAEEHYGGDFYAQDWITFANNRVDYCHENTMKVWRMMVKYATHVVVEVEFWTGSSERPTGDLPDITFGTTTYTKGKAYYILPISHFGKDYTPWRDGEGGGWDDKGEWVENSEKDPLPIDLPQPYPTDAAERLELERRNIAYTYPKCREYIKKDDITDDQEGHISQADGNYLGRWGVVRNNWYVINIQKVEGFGLNTNPIEHPEIITEDPTPLDYYKKNLICTVAVRDWQVREQSATLQ